MTDKEKAFADEWWERNNVQTVSPVSEDNGETHPYFSHFPAFGLASDVTDCHVMTL